jgi:hypothetical protein
LAVQHTVFLFAVVAVVAYLAVSTKKPVAQVTPFAMNLHELGSWSQQVLSLQVEVAPLVDVPQRIDV